MCVNFRAATLAEIEAIIADDIQGDLLYAGAEVFPGYTAPIIRRDATSGRKIVEVATFGMIPAWAKDRTIARKTYNARSETVGEKPSFRTAWSKGHFCLIPVSQYYEPSWETGKAVRWSIGRTDVASFCIAGIWAWNSQIDGGVASFSLLTINADEHSVLRRFHGPDDEKRSIVHVRPEEYDAWLSAGPEVARVMLELPEALTLRTEAAPLPPRARKAKAGQELDASK